MAPFGSNGVSFDMTVGGLCITLISPNNYGFSIQENGENGLDFDFTSFSGKLKVKSVMRDESVLLKEEALIKASSFVTACSVEFTELENEKDVCTRLHACINDGNETIANTRDVAALEVTELHIACQEPNISVTELSNVLVEHPEAALQVDERGRYPLHVFSENTVLLTSLVDYRRNVQQFVVALLKAYPEALFSSDDNGNVPFLSIIRQWIEGSYNQSTETASGFVGAAQATTKLAITRTSSNNGEEEQLRSDNHFPKVTMPPFVITVFKILSSYLELLNEGNAPRETQLDVRCALARQLAIIPLLIQTIYLIENDIIRKQVLILPIIKRVLFCVESVGIWVSDMLRYGQVPSKRAVDYLCDVSSISASDYAGQAPTSEDTDAYENDKTLLYGALETIGQIVPSLTVIREDEKGRAATTDVVWTIITQSISRPLVIGIQSADFVFNLLLLLTFRYATGTNNLVLTGTEGALSIQAADSLVLGICLYFLMRKLSEIYSVLRISKKTFLKHYIDFWNCVELLAVIFATLNVFWTNESAAMLALIMALLWLKFLSFLTAVNLHLATFIMAVVDIVKDIKWFLVVLALSLFMFGDIIQIITQQSKEDYCNSDAEVPPEFCNDSTGAVFLKLFALVAGDMNFDEFRYSTAIELIFAVFALLGVIVLLNVLIAVVSDSYQKSVENSSQLFGRARLDFVVKVVAQESFLRGTNFPKRERICSFSNLELIGAQFGRFSVLACLAYTAIISEYCVVMLAWNTFPESFWWVFIAVVFGLLLLVSIPLVFLGILETPLRNFANRKGLSWINVCLDTMNHAGKICGKFLFGTGALDEEPDIEGDPRVQRIEASMAEVAASTKDYIVESMEASERRLKAHTLSTGESIGLRLDTTSFEENGRKNMF